MKRSRCIPGSSESQTKSSRVIRILRSLLRSHISLCVLLLAYLCLFRADLLLVLMFLGIMMFGAAYVFLLLVYCQNVKARRYLKWLPIPFAVLHAAAQNTDK